MNPRFGDSAQPHRKQLAWPQGASACAGGGAEARSHCKGGLPIPTRGCDLGPLLQGGFVGPANVGTFPLFARAPFQAEAPLAGGLMQRTPGAGPCHRHGAWLDPVLPGVQGFAGAGRPQLQRRRPPCLQCPRSRCTFCTLHPRGHWRAYAKD